MSQVCEVVFQTGLLAETRRHTFGLPDYAPVHSPPLGFSLSDIWLRRTGVFGQPQQSKLSKLPFDPAVPSTAKVLTRPKPARLPWCRSRLLQGFTPPTSP